MAKISAKEFIGTRGRMHRMSDGAIVNGWVQNIQGSHIQVQVEADVQVEIGEQYRFELHGPKFTAVFEATLTKRGRVTVPSLAAPYQIEGSAVRVPEADLVPLLFTIHNQFRFANAIKAFRTIVRGVPAVLKLEESELEVAVVDVGARGFGALAEEPIAPGTRVKYEVRTSLGPVYGTGVARYCCPNKTKGHRIGVDLQTMGRIDHHRWKRFVNEL